MFNLNFIVMKNEFIVEPQDVLHAEMDDIRGGSSESLTISCSSGRVKCKGDGNIDVPTEPDKQESVLSIF